MKTIHVDDTVHTALRLKAIHAQKKLGEIVNEALSLYVNGKGA